MKNKNVISILVLVFFAFMGGGSFSEGELKFYGILLVVGVIVCIIVSVIQGNKDQKEKIRKDKEKEETERRKTNQYNEDLHNLSIEYGEITNKIEFKDKSKYNCILIFAETKKAWIIGHAYDFKDIIGCSLSDNSHIEKGTVTYETKTSTGSMLGRAVVGGVLTGGVGAVIGGATAKKNTVAVPQGNDKMIHDYTVLVNINSLTTPIVRVRCGSDGAKANDIVAIMNVIIRQNNN